jgi:hypothetical protein
MLYRASVSLIVLAFFCGVLPAQMGPADIAPAQLLRDRIVALSPAIRADEAQLAADCAYATAE